MYLIVGLGNPGNQYHFTRHNFGFLALDFYFKIKNLTWSSSSKYQATWAKTNLDLTKHSRHATSRCTIEAIFIKPETFYNDTGTPVANFANFYKIPPEKILVLCDDFNLEFGTSRLREKGSDGGNNGLKSISQKLGTANFQRLRLGTANDLLRHKIGDTDFVLGRFTEKEKAILPQILTNFCQRIDDFLLQ